MKNISMIIVACVREHILNLDCPVLWRGRNVVKNCIIYRKLFTIIDAWRPVEIELNVFIGNMAVVIQGFYMKQLAERVITDIYLFRLFFFGATTKECPFFSGHYCENKMERG